MTVVLAAPVLHAPSDRVFGRETVGRHHDPFTTMAHLAEPPAGSVYRQPVTDIPGRLLSKAFGPVAGYNLLVLLTFPLSAAAAYALARHLAIRPAFSLVAALAFAFAPFHLAQAAYHAHIAQTQWLPVYLLALWRGLDRGTPSALAWLAAAVGGVALSNFYGGLVAAITTPAAVVGYWSATRDAAHAGRRLVAACTTLVAVAAIGTGWAWVSAHPAMSNPRAFAYPSDDLVRYSATWWSYLVPPLAHPGLGDMAADVWNRAAVREGRLEQQVSLGWGFIALAGIAAARWFHHDRSTPVVYVPVLVLVAAVAFVCSLSPEWTAGGVTIRRPSGLIHDLLPMFRSYARFGMALQLTTVLLAAIGAQQLWNSDRRVLRAACVTLIIVAAAEYAVWPPALSRDVLPTRAHRWVVDQIGTVRALDCTAVTVESQSVPWLSGGRVAMRTGAFDECTAPDVAGRLAAEGYTHAIVQAGSSDAQWIRAGGTLPGLERVARFRDADVFGITAAPAVVYTGRVTGFYPREYDGARTWRWMGPPGAWDVISTARHTVTTAVDVELAAFGRAQRLTMRLDGREVQVIEVAEDRRRLRLGPLVLTPGRHTVAFEAVGDGEAPAGHGIDPRPLAVAFGAWWWIMVEE